MISKGAIVHHNAHVADTAIVERDVVISKGASVWHYSHIRYSAHIEPNANIGNWCYIDFQVTIPQGCRVGNHVSIWNGVQLGNNCFIGPSVVFCNDKHPQAGNPIWVRETTRIGNRVSIGAGAVILPGVKIGDGACIGAGATITKNVEAYTTVVGVDRVLRKNVKI